MKRYHIDVTYGGIPVKGTITQTEDPEQKKLFDDPAKHAETAVGLITDKMFRFLSVRGKWNEKMTFDEAHALIGEIKQKEGKIDVTERPPWEREER